MKQIALDNQSRTIRRLRAKLTTERRESAATKERLETKVFSLEKNLQIQRCDNHSLRNTVTLCHTDIDGRISQLVEAKREHKTNQVALEASHKTIAGLTEIGLCMSKKVIWSVIISCKLASKRPKIRSKSNTLSSRPW
ncbi:hypothetical protein F511_43997 [Dorcoceras hygrometricum]|uniref:Uncharacterized protein n=1 Tax=Dorcoceras hygrometricum TaxID=472368 RepID=A0A2Z7AIX2_9LAMI|nr:hypothetical protein F511_43997 [Dorcoceras hygrometricum]